jgi:hypothetical protein
LVVIF